MNNIFEFKGMNVEVETVSYDNMWGEQVSIRIDGHITSRKPESPFNIKKVIFNEPATIVMWADGTKTVVKCQDGDIYDKRTGLLLCMAKKMYGNKNKFNDILNKWCPEEEPIRMSDVIDYILGETPKVVGQYIFGGKADA